MAKPKQSDVRAYTTRRMDVDLLARLRVLAAVKSAEEGRRVTMEVIVEEALKRGIPILEKEIL